jgi:hypothetical protein
VSQLTAAAVLSPNPVSWLCRCADVCHLVAGRATPEHQSCDETAVPRKRCNSRSISTQIHVPVLRCQASRMLPSSRLHQLPPAKLRRQLSASQQAKPGQHQCDVKVRHSATKHIAVHAIKQPAVSRYEVARVLQQTSKEHAAQRHTAISRLHHNRICRTYMDSFTRRTSGWTARKDAAGVEAA